MNIFRRKSNVLVLGCDGMLGYDVYEFLEKESHKKNSVLNKVIGLTGQQCRQYGFFNSCGLHLYLSKSIKIDYIINCIAYTDTSDIENTVSGGDKSYKVNALFPKTLADYCSWHKIKLIHISTDYVFSELFGEESPFFSLSLPCPKNTYGNHKLLGEMFIKDALDEHMYAILRTSSLYGMHRNKSFIHKVLKNYYKIAIENQRRSQQDYKVMTMVDNAYSVPTSTNIVKRSILELIKVNNFGTFNICCLSNGKGVTPYDFAVKVIKEIGYHYNERDTDKNHPYDDLFNIENPYIRGVSQESDDYHPRFSTMATDIDPDNKSYECDWKKELECFISENKDKLIDYMVNN